MHADKEDNEMKVTSVQKIKNVKEMHLTIEKSGIDDIAKVIVGASTNDDIFEFHFSGEGCAVFANQWFNMVADDIKKLKEQIKKLEKLKTPTIENFADEKPSTRADILDQAKKCVCGQREQDYGTPESNFQLIADLWNGYLGFMDHPQDQIQATDVAMMMALMKIARIRNGGGSGDSFVDLAGYAACGGEIWHGQKVKDQN